MPSLKHRLTILYRFKMFYLFVTEGIYFAASKDDMNAAK